MKLTIDEKACHKHRLSLDEFLVALMIRHVKSPHAVIQNLLNREIIESREGLYHLTPHWSDEIEAVLQNTPDKTRTDEELMALALKVQECFPKQKMRDRFNRETPYYYRCNKTEIMRHLKMFFDGYGNVSDEDIIDATKRYVASFNGNYNGKMRLAKYFIWKNDKKTVDEETVKIEQLSDLATFLENKESEDTGIESSEDWMLNTRN